jgi:hypothetical protein
MCTLSIKGLIQAKQVNSSYFCLEGSAVLNSPVIRLNGIPLYRGGSIIYGLISITQSPRRRGFAKTSVLS